MTSSKTARPVAASLAAVRVCLNACSTRTIWTALERSGLTAAEAQAALNVLEARNGGHVLYRQGALALSAVDRALSPAAAPTYDVRDAVVELGEWAADDLEAAYAVLHADMEAEVAAAQAAAVLPAPEAVNVGSPVWDAAAALEADMRFAPMPGASRGVVLTWLLEREGQLHAFRTLVGQLRAARAADAPEVHLADAVVRRVSRALLERAGGLGHPASTRGIVRRLAACG